MIKSVCSGETERLFRLQRCRKFRAIERAALRRLIMLDAAPDLATLAAIPGNRLERLRGERENQHSIRINHQWRICFEWKDGGACQVEITDYHSETLMPKKLKPVHPGEILREEFMKPLGLSMNRMAIDLRVPLTRIADIFHERRGITTDTALRLARYFKTSPTFWLNLQTRYDLEAMGGREAERIARDVRPLEVDVTREA